MSSRAYYNEFDPKAAAWLRELIKGGLIAPGDVDERSITDVLPSDLHGYTQCHFFAGIGGWSYALRLAGVPDDQPIWTGSCPCQPFSSAGKQLGTADERHLWPAFARLIQANRPAIVFGEQVASAAGRTWLAGVFADLEGMAYYRAAADLCAAGVGAPHIRQRLYWMAHSNSSRCFGSERYAEGEAWDKARMLMSGADCETCGMAHSGGERRQQITRGASRDEKANGREGWNWREPNCNHQFASDGENRGGMGNTDNQGPQGHRGSVEQSIQTVREREERHSSKAGFWGDSEWLPFLDGKARRVESGTFPLAHGVSGRVGLLRGYGNAIVPQVAAQFIQAAFEAIGDHDGRSDVLMDDPAF